ncbi:MAG TPA: class I SAM-dependent methyltransferase [Candidatus Dormibacteraeota bacterium]|nr:class I SAM-dependent methyltransferase [Candidatus Dormibacteraeota bacterium]
MPANATEWDARHRAAAREAAPEPSSIVLELLPLLPHGPALDLACGTGRHTLVLAGRGQNVTAVDASAVALSILEERAREASMAVWRGNGLGERPAHSGRGILLVEADLEATELPAASFDLILCVQYLQRSLFAQMASALRPGGMLLFETYTRAQMDLSGGPRNPEFLLGTHELRGAFPGLRTIFYRELRAEKGIASLLAQKPA